MPVDSRERLRPLSRRLGLASHSVIAFTAFGLAASIVTPSAQAQNAQDAQQQAQSSAPTTLPPVSAETESEGEYKVDNSASPKFTAPLLDTPKTVTVITDDVIEERGASTLMDVLRTVPGITMGAGEGGVPAGDRAFIRGFDARGDMFVDGQRDGGVTIRDPFNSEQVEVTKGPGSAYTGRGSTGGSINLISKTPKAEDFREGSLTLGTDMTKRGTIDWNEAIDENTAVRVNVMAHDADVAGRDAVENTRYGIAPSVTFGMAGPTQLTLSYYHLQTDGLTDYGHPFDPNTGKPIDVERDNFYGLTSRDTQETSNDILTARLEHRFNEVFTVTNQLRFNKATNNYITTLPGTVTATTVGRGTRSRDEERETLSNQTDLISKFKTGGIDHSLVTGLELSREDFINRGRTISGTPPVAHRFDPDPSQTYSYTVTYSGNNSEATTDTIALYVFDTLKLSPQWEVSAGARLDHIETDTTSGVGGVNKFEREDTLPSWQAGIVYKPASNGSIYASYGTSFNTSAEFDSLNNETVLLEPEKNNSYELGTKWDLFNERLSVTGAVFRTEKTNTRVNDNNGITQLDGETRVDGVEIGLDGSITPEWKVFGGYTYMKSEIVDDGPAATNDGNKVPSVAPHNLSLWTTYDVTRAWTVGGGALYIGKRYANTANSQYVDSYWRFDAMVSHQLTEDVALRVNFLNLTDETYYDGLQSGRADVAPGRTILLTTDVKF